MKRVHRLAVGTALRSIALPAGAVLAACLLAGTAARVASVTVDEFGYLPHGLAWLDRMSLRLPDGNPPQFKMLSALPVRFGSHEWRSDWAEDAGRFWALGAQFMRANAGRYQELYERARVVPLAFLALTCVLTYVLAARLYGRTAGIFAVWLTALNPNLLGHGSLVTPDIFFTAALLAVLVVADLFLHKPSAALAALLGVLVGVACLFKITGLLLALLLFGASFVRGTRVNTEAAGTTPWSAARYRVVCVVAAALTVHLGYLFEGSFATFGALQLQHPLFSMIVHKLPWLPTVLPADFVTTVDFQLSETAAGGYIAYLDGHQSQTGFFDYYIRGLLYKTPLLTLGLVLLAACAGGRIKRREAPMVLVGVGMFAAFSLLRSKNIGIRYVLFLYPLMHVWVGRLLADGCAVGRLVGRRTITAAVVLGIAAAMSSEVLIWPHHLAYFNTLAGGPSGGPAHLLDSNVDWGQDLILLKRFMQEKRIETIDLAYFGRVDPAVYGVRYRTLDATSRERWAAVSVNFIYGRSYFINGSQVWADAGEYRRFQSVPPVSRLGYSLYVFDLGTDVAVR